MQRWALARKGQATEIAAWALLAAVQARSRKQAHAACSGACLFKRLSHFFFLSTWLPTTPPTTAPAAAPVGLPPVSTAPATPPTPAPVISFLLRLEQPVIAAAANIAANA